MSFSLSWGDVMAFAGVILPILAAIAILVVGWVLGRMAQRAIVRWLPRAGGTMVTLAPLSGQAARYAILILAIVTALNFVGIPSTSILTVIGAASLALALALQNTLSNVAAGIMLAWLRPIAVGEYITGDGIEGVVVEVGLFGTRLRSTSGLYVFTNNNRLWNGPITNHSREPRRRVDVNITLPDSADIGSARRALLELSTRDTRVLGDPAPAVFVDSFGTTTVTLQMRVWVPTPEYRAVLRDLTEASKLSINTLLAAGDGGVAQVAEATDPHIAQTGGHAPDVGN